MKKLYVTFGVVLIVILTLAGVVNAFSGTWNSGVDVQNLTGSVGTVAVEFYSADGTSVGSLANNTIAAWGSLNFYLPSESAPPSGGQYSAVVSSDVEVGVTASQWDYDTGGADIYLGTSAPETTLSYPLVYRDHTSGHWYSQLTVQNTTGTAEDVTLRLYNAGSSAVAYTKVQNIPAYASYTFDLTQGEYVAFGPYGSATVTSVAELAGVADNLRDPGTGKVNVIESTYRAFGAGQQGQSVVAPLVYKNYNLWTTGINVLNKGAISTTVSITYTNANPGVSGGPWIDTLELGPNAMGVFYTPINSTGLPDSFYGSAELSSSASDIAVVVASQRYRTDGAQGVAYEGSLPSSATACVSLPVVHNRTTWKTGINILNLGNADAAVTISYKSSATGINDASQNVTVPANSPLTVYMPSDATTALGFYGAADVKSTNGQPLLVNSANSRSDKGVGSNFVGINYTCP